MSSWGLPSDLPPDRLRLDGWNRARGWRLHQGLFEGDTMNEGRQITKEQAEACMRADAEFAMKGNYVGSYIFDGDDTLYSEGTPANYTKKFRGLVTCVWDVVSTIAADPNGTFERLYGTPKLETREDAIRWLIDHKDEELLVSTPSKSTQWTVKWDGSKFKSKFAHDHSYCAKGEFSFAFAELFEVFTPSPKTPDERIAELEARVAELEANK